MMIRTQVYLTEEEKMALIQLGVSTGKTQSEMIRLAIDYFIKTASFKNRSAFGMWKDNPFDFKKARREMDR